LIHQRLELNLLDLVEEVAGLDDLTLPEWRLFKEAFDACAKFHLVHGFDVSDELEGLVYAA
jgi:hypothetical protein